MPFKADYQGSFTRQSIEIVPSTARGVYGLYTSVKWVYVGMGDIRDRLLSHLNGDNPCINRNSPNSYIAEVTSNPAAREEALIGELNPTCNQRVG